MKAVKVINTIILFSFCLAVSGQTETTNTSIAAPDILNETIHQEHEQNYYLWMFYPRLVSATAQSASSDHSSFKYFQRDFSLSLPYSNSLFCRIERQLQQHTRLPIRFRLGSLQYTNELEGKCSR